MSYLPEPHTSSSSTDFNSGCLSALLKLSVSSSFKTGNIFQILRLFPAVEMRRSSYYLPVFYFTYPSYFWIQVEQLKRAVLAAVHQKGQNLH